jgi:hypothetical protein
VTSQKVQLKNKVTDADGDKSTLTFEVWTADAAGTPLKKVSIADNEWGVIVSPYDVGDDGHGGCAGGQTGTEHELCLPHLGV